MLVTRVLIFFFFFSHDVDDEICKKKISCDADDRICKIFFIIRIILAGIASNHTKATNKLGKMVPSTI